MSSSGQSQLSVRRTVPRRDFVKLGSAVAATAASASLCGSRFVHAATPTQTTESIVGELFHSLTDDQKQAVWRPFNHKDRRKINPNWHVSKTFIGDFSKSQQEMVTRIVRGITSDDGYERLLQQMDDDDGGIDAYSFAIFGKPGAKDFQFEMTGRHLTMRADGNRDDHVAFGGPIVYGHSEEIAKENLFYYQTQKANEVFQALDAEQAKKALLKKSPKETAVQLQGEQGRFPGVPVESLSSDQKELVESTLKVLLAPYREQDVNEVLGVLKSSGGLDKLHLAYYQDKDLNSDQEWDVWRVEGPSLVWHFRGAPHVHAYINIGVKS